MGLLFSESVAGEVRAMTALFKVPCDCGADNLPHEHGSACPPKPVAVQEGVYDEVKHPRGRGGKFREVSFHIHVKGRKESVTGHDLGGGLAVVHRPNTASGMDEHRVYHVGSGNLVGAIGDKGEDRGRVRDALAVHFGGKDYSGKSVDELRADAGLKEKAQSLHKVRAALGHSPSKPGSKLSRRSGHGLLTEASIDAEFEGLVEAATVSYHMGGFADWDPRLHPRARGGKFAEVLGKLSHGGDVTLGGARVKRGLLGFTVEHGDTKKHHMTPEGAAAHVEQIASNEARVRQAGEPKHFMARYSPPESHPSGHRVGAKVSAHLEDAVPPGQRENLRVVGTHNDYTITVRDATGKDHRIPANWARETSPPGDARTSGEIASDLSRANGRVPLRDRAAARSGEQSLADKLRRGEELNRMPPAQRKAAMAASVPAVAGLLDTSPERLAQERTDRALLRHRSAHDAVTGNGADRRAQAAVAGLSDNELQRNFDALSRAPHSESRSQTLKAIDAEFSRRGPATVKGQKRVSKAQALVDSGLADDLKDARAQLADMGEGGGMLSPGDYDAALAAHNVAAREFAAAQAEYRNRKDTDFDRATDKFLAAKAKYDAATVVFDAAHAAAAGMASPGEPKVGKSGAYVWKGDRVEGLQHIVGNHQAHEIDGHVVDVTTANLLLSVHGALSPENKAKFGSLPLPSLVDFAWKRVK